MKNRLRHLNTSSTASAHLWKTLTPKWRTDVLLTSRGHSATCGRQELQALSPTRFGLVSDGEGHSGRQVDLNLASTPNLLYYRLINKRKEVIKEQQ